MNKFTEVELEQAFVELLGNEGYPHFVGSSVVHADEDEVLIEEDLKAYLLNRYQNVQLIKTEAQSIIRWSADGLILRREDRSQKDIHISFIDYTGLNRQLRRAKI